MSARDDILAAHAAGAFSNAIALARLLLTGEVPEPGSLPPALERLAAAHRDRLEPLAALAREGFDAGDPASAAALFDGLATRAPEAAVAFYSLGDPALLAAATDELVATIRAWAPLAGRDAVDFGCGFGRVAQPLAREARSVVGLDVSASMIAEAERRRAGIANLRYRTIAGDDVPLPDTSVDLIVAADSFPFIVQGGASLLERTMDAFARVLRAGGDLLVFNWSYRGDPAVDIAEAHAVAARHGFTVVRAGERPFAIWDGVGFHLRRTA